MALSLLRWRRPLQAPFLRVGAVLSTSEVTSVATVIADGSGAARSSFEADVVQTVYGERSGSSVR